MAAAALNGGPMPAAPSASRSSGNMHTTIISSRPKTPAMKSSSVQPVPLNARRADKLDMNTVDRKGNSLRGMRREIPSRHHHGACSEVPTFYPSEQEFKNPMEYITKVVKPEGIKYGAAKIVPPASWDPPFTTDTERFHFHTRKQELNSVEGGTRTNLSYVDRLTKFHKDRGLDLRRLPTVDKQPLKLYELKQKVDYRGGFHQVCSGKRWAEIGRDLGYQGKIMSSLSTSLKNSYAKWILPYEEYCKVHAGPVQARLEMERGGPYGTPSPGPSPMKKSHQHTPSGLSKHSPAVQASQAFNETLQNGVSAVVTPPSTVVELPRPSSGFTAVNASGFTAVNAAPVTPLFAQTTNGPKVHEQTPNQTNGTISSSLPKILNSPPRSLAEPHDLDKKRAFPVETSDGVDVDSDANGRRSKRVKKEVPHTVVGSNMMQPKFSTARVLSSKDRKNDSLTDSCEICGKADNDTYLLGCEGCDDSYHTYCLDPNSKATADADWHCPKCLVGTGEFGFEEGETYSLKQFQHKANFFKEKHFARRNRDSKSTGPSETEVEDEFWRLVSSLTDTVEVEYGADIHSTTHGSGFPTIERNPRSPYAIDAWNLNNLPLHQDSLFRHINADISGMTVPWLYVGMVFSTFCWHKEDHCTYSANYQHFGDTKTWYCIPGSDAARFEEAMKSAVPDLFEKQPDLLYQLVTLLPPLELRKAGVNVFAIDQRAGEFVITFPNAYHAGFNHGFNFNEAVNFAPADWEPFGQVEVQKLKEFRRQPCFSHDKLLLTACAAKDISIKTAKWLAPAFQQMLDRELANRNAFEELVEEKRFIRPRGDEDFRLQIERVTEQHDMPEDDYVCSYCKTYSYLSRFTCKNSGKIACLDHVGYVDCCHTSDGHTVHTRTTTYRLEQTAQKIAEKANLPEAWTAKFNAAIDDTPKPQLKMLRTLLAEGERIPWSLPDLASLRAFVERCNDWVEEAQTYITRKQQNRRKNDKVWRKGSSAKLAEMEERDKEMRRVENVNKLLVEAAEIGFDCPDITTLQERADAIAEFQKKASTILSNIAQHGTADVEELIEEGRGFFVEIPEVEHLDKIARQMRWVDKAKDRSQQKTLQDVDDLIQQASELNVPERNEQLFFLREQKTKGEQWEVKAKELMSAETVHYPQLDSFSKQAAELPVTKETLAAIDAILKTQREAQEKITSLCDRSQLEDYRQRPHFAEVRDVQDAINDLSSKPPGNIELDIKVKRQTDWIRAGKKLFGKTNAPLHILLQHMQIVDKHNKSCFDLTDKPKLVPVEPASRAGTPDPANPDSGSTRDVFCLCRQPEAGTMIMCAQCLEWYHGKCLKIARGKIKQDEDFICPVCDYRVKIPRDAARPKLEEFQDWFARMEDLPFQADEEETAQSIIDTALAFRDEVAKYIQPDSIVGTRDEVVPTHRFYLRKIEGADVLLTAETNYFRKELHKWHPIAPEAPPTIEVSHSTRKPRPTKQQKLMKDMGIENPDDLPQNLRTKPYNHGKRKAQDEARKQPRPILQPVLTGHANGRNAINFRPPITANAFPTSSRRNRNNSKSPESPPLFSPASASNSFVNPNSTLAPINSPFATNTADSGSEPRGSMIDPGLFGSSLAMSGFADDDPDAPVEFMRTVKSEESDRLGDDHEPDSNETTMFDGPGSSQQSGGNFDIMFADLTNQDDDAVLHGGENVDPDLL